MRGSPSFFSQRYRSILDLVPIRVESNPVHVKSSSLPLWYGCRRGTIVAGSRTGALLVVLVTVVSFGCWDKADVALVSLEDNVNSTGAAGFEKLGKRALLILRRPFRITDRP